MDYLAYQLLIMKQVKVKSAGDFALREGAGSFEPINPLLCTANSLYHKQI